MYDPYRPRQNRKHGFVAKCKNFLSKCWIVAPVVLFFLIAITLYAGPFLFIAWVIIKFMQHYGVI